MSTKPSATASLKRVSKLAEHRRESARALSRLRSAPAATLKNAPSASKNAHNTVLVEHHGQLAPNGEAVLHTASQLTAGMRVSHQTWPRDHITHRHIAI